MTSTDLNRAHVAVLTVFALAGAAFASWAARIPDIKRILDLDPRALGLLLLAGSLGSVLLLPLSGHIANRLGVARALVLGTGFAATGITGLGLAVGVAEDVRLAAPALFVTGLGIALWDVAMNLEGAHVERGLGRSVMPHYHAAFSAGTVAAALLAAGLVGLRVPVWVHLPLIALACLAGVVLALRSCRPGEPPAEEDADQPRARNPWTEPRTLLIGVVTLVAAFTEGTANDWISVAFVEGHGVPGWAGVLAFAVFLSFMTIGRLAGTKLLDTYGRVPVLRVMFGLALVGCLIVVFTPAPYAYLGAAVWGIGVALGFPVGMSAAADDPRLAHARLSVVATVGYGAFLAGPPLLGLLGHEVGVLRALLVVGAALLLAVACLPAVREPQPVQSTHRAPTAS